MSLNRNEVNPLNVLGLRKLSFIPDHFTKIYLEHKIDTKAVSHWIEFNLNSRYAIAVSQGLDNTRKVIQLTEIGLEDPKEVTMLTLGCSHLHKFKKEY